MPAAVSEEGAIEPAVKLKIQEAKKSFIQGSGKKHVAIDGLSFTVGDNEYVAIVGPTGAGKSVLFDCVLGLKRLDEGEIQIDGIPAANFAKLHPGRITRIFQEDRLLPWLTAVENAALGLLFRGVSENERTDIAGHWLDSVNLGAFRHCYPREMSGGMRQRVNIARAFAPEPELVLLDEPFSALDEITAAKLRQDFKTLAKQRRSTFLIVTHSIEEAIFLANRIIVVGAPARVVADISVPAGAHQSVAEVERLRVEIRNWIDIGSRKT
ncbi:MAG: ATP-binding cassette domain-containing protein [Pseudolabrys sp.]|nr:ATP-binding cassette domain-containing protein [Pseudolabrys sp.]